MAASIWHPPSRARRAQTCLRAPRKRSHLRSTAGVPQPKALLRARGIVSTDCAVHRRASVRPHARPDGIAAERALARTSPLEDEEWRNTVELPTLRLAREALPLLSTGWGVSLFAVGSSFAGLAVASFLLVLKLASLKLVNGAAALVPASLAAFAVWLFCKVVTLSRFVALSSR